MIRRGLVRGEDGAAAVEFAVVMPILVLLFFGIVFYGLTIYRQQVVESATREAARAMAVGATVGQIEQVLDGAAASSFASDEISVQRDRFARDDATVASSLDMDAIPCDGRTEIATVSVRATGDRLNFSIPFSGGGGYVADFRATASFRCEV